MYKLENNSVLCVSNIRDEQHATEKKSFLKWQNVLQMRQNWTTFEGYAVSRNGGRRTKVFPKFVKNFRNEVFSRLVLFLFKVTFAYFGSSIKFLPFTFLFLSLSSIQCAHFRLSKPTLYHGFPSTSWSTLTTYLPLHECFLSLSLSLSLSLPLSPCATVAHTFSFSKRPIAEAHRLMCVVVMIPNERSAKTFSPWKKRSRWWWRGSFNDDYSVK